MTKEQVLQKCTVEGNIVKLPPEQLERKLYQEVAKSLELIGGKWKGGKVFGFVFVTDPTDLLYEIANGEKRNLKKEFQFFATPRGLAKEMVIRANINADLRILEPSAGQGAIVNEILKAEPGLLVHCYELMDVNRLFLSKINDCIILGNDFLNIAYYAKFDRIIANPPFSGNQDIDHIKKMYDVCDKGGRIVTIASKHWQFSNNKKETEFREWLHKIGATIEELEPGTFKESGTNISAVLIVIDK